MRRSEANPGQDQPVSACGLRAVLEGPFTLRERENLDRGKEINARRKTNRKRKTVSGKGRKFFNEQAKLKSMHVYLNRCVSCTIFQISISIWGTQRANVLCSMLCTEYAINKSAQL